MASRAERRVETDTRIMDAARSQLAEVGAAALSLRTVARDVGMVSSAVYRYVDSRDTLLTRLITEAYDSLGDAVDDDLRRLDEPTDLERWVAVAIGVRRWAVARRHEYLLLYGSPVPGYAAPDATVTAGTRVARRLAEIVTTAATNGRTVAPTRVDVHPELVDDLSRLAGAVDVDLPPDVLAALLTGWSQMFGLIGFELTSQTRGVVEHHEHLLVAGATQTGRAVGLR